MELKELLDTVPQVGRLEWIGRAAERCAPIEILPSVELAAGTGLAGDHHATSGQSVSQVTLIQAEHLAVIASLLGSPTPVPPEQLRRNLTIRGINLLSLKRRRFRIGPCLLEGSGPCPPCSRIETQLGPGGYQATRGHGGITARVLEGGTIRLGDPVTAE